MTDYIPPHVGPYTDEWRPICLYARQPGDPQCGQPATRHVLLDTEGYGTVGLASCDAHAPIARIAGRFLLEHDYDGVCGFPGTLWHHVANVCVLDGSGRSPARQGVREAVRT